MQLTSISDVKSPSSLPTMGPDHQIEFLGTNDIKLGLKVFPAQ